MKFLITLFIVVFTQSLAAQHEPYLHIEKADGIESSISYPPNTEFHLFDGDGNYVLSDGDLKEPFEIKTTHTLLLNPPYKDDTDRLVLESGRIFMKKPYENDTTKSDTTSKTKDYGHYKGSITARKEYFESKIQGERNILLVFSNDLIFRYFDGKAKAWFDGDEVLVKGNYIVKLPYQTAKISYNPKNGETWWTFENND